MNLGGRRIANEDLRDAVEAIGFAGAATFRASGNVIFSAGGADGASLQRRLEQGLGERLGYEVPVFIRSAAELREISGFRPFGTGAPGAKLQVVLLGSEPAASARREALALAGEEDPLAFAGRELYWLPSRGVGGSALKWSLVERVLGPTTTRTMGTIEQIVARWFEPAGAD